MATTPAQVLDQAIQLSERCDRTDLHARLRQSRRRLLDPSVRVLVVGEFKKGKSLMVNALVNAPVCPVDDDVATSVPTVIKHGDVPLAELVYSHDSDSDDDDAPVDRTPVPLRGLAEHVSEAGNPGNERRLLCAEVQLPRKLLTDGLTLVDTPGVGGLGSAHSISTLAALPTADAVLLVSDAAQEYSEPEIEFLRHAVKLCPNVACVLTKTDQYPQWRRIAELDRIHLAGAGVEAELLPVSSTLRLHAIQSEDTELNAESGFPELTRYLRRDVAGKAALLARRSVSNDVLSVADQLTLSLRSELEALQDPERNQALIGELEEAREQADQLGRRSARWQHTLGDGVTDLLADIEYDLRDRLRKVSREAEQAIDDTDPGKVWEQFGEWLERRIAGAVADNFVWANERSQWLAAQVAEHFAEDSGDTLSALHVGDTEGVLDPVAELEDVDSGKLVLTQKLLIGLRGSYGGVLMFGLITAFAGLPLLNPISVGAGFMLGIKAYRDDQKTRLTRRRADAKTAVRRQVDDVIFQVNKQSKDRLRQVQRLLRDHFTGIAEDLRKSLTDSVTAAQKAAKTDASQRDRRIQEIKGELERINLLQKSARALTRTATK